MTTPADPPTPPTPTLLELLDEEAEDLEREAHNMEWVPSGTAGKLLERAARLRAARERLQREMEQAVERPESETSYAMWAVVHRINGSAGCGSPTPSAPPPAANDQKALLAALREREVVQVVGPDPGIFTAPSAPLGTLAPAPAFVSYPKDRPPRYNGSGTPCDTWKGPCSCGAWHGGADDVLERSPHGGTPTTPATEPDSLAPKRADVRQSAREIAENFCHCSSDAKHEAPYSQCKMLTKAIDRDRAAFTRELEAHFAKETARLIKALEEARDLRGELGEARDLLRRWVHRMPLNQNDARALRNEARAWLTQHEAK